MVNNTWTKERSTTTRDIAGNNFSCFERKLPDSAFRSSRPKLCNSVFGELCNSVFGERMSRKKLFLSPLWRPAGGFTSSPVPFVEGFLVLPLWIAAYCSGDANPSCWFPGNGFISPWALDADPLRSYASPCVGF